jgi:predicted porin
MLSVKRKLKEFHMQKKIIALAIAAAISAPAFADTSNVTVYGVADVSFDSIKTGTTTAGVAGNTVNGVSSNTSRFGIKGSEDLGDGLSAIFQIETVINIGAGNATTNAAAPTLGGRNTFAGLSSKDLGTVLMGRHDTPYKISTRKFDMFGDGIADNRSIMGGNTASATGQNVVGKATAGASFDGRQDQVVAYISPKLGEMFTGAIAYVNLSPVAALSTSAKNSAWSMAGMFDIAGGFYGSLAYEVHDFVALTTAVKTNEKATKLGLGYTQDAFAVGFAYEKTSDNLGALNANLMGHNAYYLSGKYNVNAADAVKFAYTKAGQAGAVLNTGANQYALGYDHAMSKRTTLYVLYTKLSNQSAAGYSLSNNSTLGGAGANAGVGASPSALALGMKHTF